MIYPSGNKIKMAQLSGDGASIQAELTGAHRIYSRKDTKKIVEMAKDATTPQDLIKLGRYVYAATKQQDMREPEYTEE